MKNWIRTLLLAAALCCALCVTTLAADDQNGYALIVESQSPYLSLSLSTPTTPDQAGYCAVLYCSEEMDVYQELRYDHYNSMTDERTFTAVKGGTYDRVRILQGRGSRFEDPDAVILADWAFYRPIVVQEDAFELPETAALEEARKIYDEAGYCRYILTGVGEQYSYIARDACLDKTHNLNGRQGLYFSTLEGCPGVEIYGLEITQAEDRYIQRVSKAVHMEIPAAETEGYGVRVSVEKGMLYAALEVPADADQDHSYYLFLYDSTGVNRTTWSAKSLPGERISLEFITANVDRVRICEGSDSDEYLVDLALDKPIIGLGEVFEFPGSVSVTARKDPDGAEDAYIYSFEGLQLDQFAYILTSGRKDWMITEPVGYSDDTWLNVRSTLQAFIAVEEADYYGIASSTSKSLYIKPEEKDGKLTVTVNGGGTVTLANCRVEINGIEISTGTEDISYTTEGELELVCKEIPGGYYDVVITRPGCLPYTIQKVAVVSKDVDLGTIDLIAGDVNEDGKINIADMGVFRAEFGKTGEDIGNSYTDVNGDGKVNIADMGIFRQNFGKTAEKDCTVKY